MKLDTQIENLYDLEKEFEKKYIEALRKFPRWMVKSLRYDSYEKEFFLEIPNYFIDEFFSKEKFYITVKQSEIELDVRETLSYETIKNISKAVDKIKDRKELIKKLISLCSYIKRDITYNFRDNIGFGRVEIENM